MKIKLNIQRFASGTVSLGISGKLEGKIEWTSVVQGSTDEEKATLNKSNVTATLYIRRTDQYYTLGTFNYFWQIGASSNSLGWYGRIENNQWVQIDQHTEVVNHNDDGTGSCYMTCTLHGPSGTTMSGNTISGTQTVTLDTIPRYASITQTLNTKTETTIKIDWVSDNICDYIWYSTDKGVTWVSLGQINAKSGSYTITGLTANTTYNIRTKVRRKDSQLTKGSLILPVTTWYYPYLASGSTYEIKEDRALAIAINNPLNRQVTLTIMGEDNTIIKEETGNIGSYMTTFDATERDLWYSTIPNKASGTYKVRLTNDAGTTTTNVNTYTAYEPDCTPTFNDYTYADTNATTLALTGDASILVKGYSNVQATISTANKAVGKNYADIKEYILKVGTSPTDTQPYSDTNPVLLNVNNVTSNVIQVYAKDYREFTKLVEKTLTIPNKYKEYTNIQKGSISIERQNNVGEQVTLNFNGTFWHQSFGSVTNTITNVKYRYKKTTENWPVPETWNGTTIITPTESDNTYSFSNSIVGDVAGVGFDAGYSYDIEVMVSDKLSSVTFATTLGSGSPNIAIVENGISLLGKYDEQDTTNKVQINGNTKITGNTSIVGNENVAGDIDITGNYKINGTALVIPTVNDATLTIQKNGTRVGTFTANASSNKTINILTPVIYAGTISVIQTSGAEKAITATVPSGYSFLCWLQPATNGWLGNMYVENPFSQSSKLWCRDGFQYPGGVNCCYLCIKNNS